eukprot:5970294-Prymnesium_polylepis.2
MAFRQAGRPSEAITLLQRGLPRLREALGEYDAEYLSAMSNLGAMLIEAQRADEAEPYCREVVERRCGALGARDPMTIQAMTNLASMLRLQGKLAAATAQWREVLAANRESLGGRHEASLAAMGNLAVVLLEAAGDDAGCEALEEPVALLTEELRARLRTLGGGCVEALPPLTRALLPRCHNVLMRQPNLGADVEGYDELMGLVQRVVGQK